MPADADYVDAGRRAATAFGLAVASVDVLSKSENVVLDVTLADGDHVVVRLHREGYNTLDELRSEVAFVDSLRTFGVPVPAAVDDAEGNFYVPVDVGGQQLQAGVVRWVDGMPLGGPLDGSRLDLAPQFVRIGEVAAQIRLHNDEWQAPTGFVRRRWDAEGLVGERPLWGPFWKVDQLTSAQADLLYRARNELFDELSAVSVGPGRFGLIHADLHLGNLMVDDDQLTVIDFDDAGYGWFAHELAVALHPVLDEPGFVDARRSLLEGYRSVTELDDAEEQLIDTFLAVRSLMIVGWLAARPELPAYVHLPDVIEGAVTASDRYLNR